MYWDSTYILVLIGVAISALASWNVKHTFEKFRTVSNRNRMQGAECAKEILNQAGIYDVRIEPVGGSLTDHYSPREKVLRLSESVYGSNSIAALGVAAHECGHAIQHEKEYLPLILRSISVPAAKIGSQLSWPVILLGIFLENINLANLGVLLFTLVVIFQLITLPVEFDASRRALRMLEQHNILEADELGGARKVLGAAALTYFAALLTTILQLIRLILIVRGSGRRRN